MIIDGKQTALEIREEIKQEIERLNIKPSITVIIVGNNPASTIYVNSKKKVAIKLGMDSHVIELEESISQKELEQQIEKLNNDKNTDAILVQLPLPNHIDTYKILELIDPKKDVDGFHPYNIGLSSIGLEPYAYSCTPLGIIKLLEKYNITIEGKHAVVVGRSNIVGKPMASLLLKNNATVTICHSKTKNLKEITSSADILISAVGIEHIIKEDFVKTNAVVIDVGINRNKDGKLTGDVDFENIQEKASYITPVPGGVGPMTIAMLMYNTLELYKKNKM